MSSNIIISLLSLYHMFQNFIQMLIILSQVTRYSNSPIIVDLIHNGHTNVIVKVELTWFQGPSVFP